MSVQPKQKTPKLDPQLVNQLLSGRKTAGECSTSITFPVVLPQLEMLPKKNAPHHSQAFSIKANSY